MLMSVVVSRVQLPLLTGTESTGSFSNSEVGTGDSRHVSEVDTGNSEWDWQLIAPEPKANEIAQGVQGKEKSSRTKKRMAGADGECVNCQLPTAEPSSSVDTYGWGLNQQGWQMTNLA